jgi:hypothetical protein
MDVLMKMRFVFGIIERICDRYSISSNGSPPDITISGMFVLQIFFTEAITFFNEKEDLSLYSAFVVQNLQLFEQSHGTNIVADKFDLPLMYFMFYPFV